MIPSVQEGVNNKHNNTTTTIIIIIIIIIKSCSRLKLGNACYYWVQNLLSSRLLSKNVKD